ncbi:hypothetical protein JG687_00015763 [Phytophthora cactorum]|uniref:Glucosylceramidase n=1 Tax=Phytophthora cactorum TaxID=29920 RepID=A0A8T1TTU9_9STRA|nr:hypothetical protein JG687_00015763 [Phytophthora cactorum]
MRLADYLAVAAVVSAASLSFAPCKVLAACSSWSSLYQDNLDGVCVCNETQCDSVSNDYLSLRKRNVGVFTTSQSGARLEYKEKKLHARPVSSPTFSIDVSTQYQTIIGFGAAFTDSAAINVYKLSPKLQQILLDQYFSENGLQYNLGRVSIGSNDFSTSIYSYNDVEGDLEMENFSIDVDKAPNSHKLELIQRVLNMTSRDIKLFASSWAPPAWMTKEKSTINCHLKGEPGDENWKALALYYSKFFTAYKEEGIDFWAMTVQNEPEKPLLAFAKWQTLRITPEEERDFIKFDLGPMMKKHHPNLKIIANDDQKPSILTRLEPLEDPESLQYISGVAVHWYRNVDFVLGMGGHFGKLREFHESYPDLFILPSEACEGFMPNPLGTGKGPSLTDPDKSWTRGENYGRDIIGDLNSYAGGWTDWNMVLDTKGGPNWAKNMVDAPILVDAKNGDEFYKQPMFYFMGHFAKFVPAGSRRIKMSLTEDSETELQTSVFVTPENQVVIQFLNLEGSDEVVNVQTTDFNTFTVTNRSMSRLESKQLLPLGNDHSLHSSESYVQRLLSIPREVIPLSLFAFGGPPAHLALAHDRFVYKQKWLADDRFLEVLSIASAIPGPSSTMTIAAMGLFRAGPLGGLLALFFWVLPGWAALTIAGFGAKSYLQDGLPVWLTGLAPAAVSIVVIAAARLWQKACEDDTAKNFVASVSAFLVLLAQYHPQDDGEHSLLSLFYTFYWIGSIIFGGGQVMLPMLLDNIVMAGWVSKEQFLIGLALVQSLPGPLFNISAYLGALIYGVPGALISSVGLFGPGIVLFFGLLPLWERVRNNTSLQIFLSGVNASATGLIVASFFLLWDKAVHTNSSAAVGLATVLMVGVFRVPTSMAIIVGAILGFLLSSEVFDLGQKDFCS